MSSRLVCIKIGTCRQSGNARSALQTSKPLIPGMTTSSTTQSAGSLAKLAQRGLAVGGGDDAKARHLQRGSDQQPGAGIVVDDQYVAGVWI